MRVVRGDRATVGTGEGQGITHVIIRRGEEKSRSKEGVKGTKEMEKGKSEQKDAVEMAA